MHVLGLALAALVGLSLGLLGGGGSILTVPIFVYVLGYGAKAAIAMSLPVVGVTSLVGAAAHWRRANVDPRVALTFGAVAMAGSFAGARLAAFASGTLQLTLLAIVMLMAAASMLRSAGDTDDGPDTPGDVAAARPPVAMGVLLAVGIGVGLLTGFLGIGGGFLVVPALIVLARMP